MPHLPLPLIAHEVLCAALFYTVFCRSVHLDSRAKTDIRAAFFALGVAALMGMVAPLAWAFEPTGWTIGLLSAILLVQAVTARHWGHGTPDQFLKPKHRPKNRRKQDTPAPQPTSPKAAP